MSTICGATVHHLLCWMISCQMRIYISHMAINFQAVASVMICYSLITHFWAVMAGAPVH